MKLLFIPTFEYLSVPIFSRLVPDLADQELYLLLTNELIENPDECRLKTIFTNVTIIKKNIPSNYFIILKKIYEKIKFILSLRDYINQLKPDAVITNSDAMLTIRLIKYYSPQTKIIIIQPSFFDIGVFKEKTQIQLYKKIINFIFQLPLYSKQNDWGLEYEDNHILVWGEYFFDLLKKTLSSKYLHIVGYTDMPSERINSNQLKIQHNVPVNRIVVSIFTDALYGLIADEKINEIASMYNQLIQENNQYFYIIKFHPRERQEFISTMIDKLSDKNIKIISSPQIDNNEILQMSDIQISNGSVTSFKAIVMDIPVVIFHPFGATDKLNLFDDVVIYAKNIQEIEKGIRESLNSQHKYENQYKRNIYLKKMIYQNDSQAFKRIAKIIIEIHNKYIFKE